MNVFEINYIQLLNKCFDLNGHSPSTPQIIPKPSNNVEFSRLEFVLLNNFLDLIFTSNIQKIMWL
jgi:hypothetical protein